MLSNYPANGLTTTLSGWKTYTDALDGETTREDFTCNITFFNNITTGNWDFYMAEADDWSVYMDGYDEATDTRYQTPTYNCLPYAYSPIVPLGMIQVQHSIIHGTTFEPPIEEISSNLMIHFYV